MQLGHRGIGITFGLLGAASLFAIIWMTRPPFYERSMGVVAVAGMLAYVLTMFGVSLRLELKAKRAALARSATPKP